MTDAEHKAAIDAATKALNEAMAAAQRDGLELTLAVMEGQPNLRTGLTPRALTTRVSRPVI